MQKRIMTDVKLGEMTQCPFRIVQYVTQSDAFFCIEMPLGDTGFWGEADGREYDTLSDAIKALPRLDVQMHLDARERKFNVA